MEWLALQPYKVNGKLRTLYLYLDLVNTADGPRYVLPGSVHQSRLTELMVQDPRLAGQDDEKGADIVAMKDLPRREHNIYYDTSSRH